MGETVAVVWVVVDGSSPLRGWIKGENAELYESAHAVCFEL